MMAIKGMNRVERYYAENNQQLIRGDIQFLISSATRFVILNV